MEQPKHKWRTKTGNYGQAVILADLRKNGVNCIEIGGAGLGGVADILCETGLTIEVKTSLPTTKVQSHLRAKDTAKRIHGWQFQNILRSHSNYTAYVLLKHDLSVHSIIYRKKETVNGKFFIIGKEPTSTPPY